MSRKNFVRISASENTFIFIDATEEAPELISKSFGFNKIDEFVKAWTMGSNGLMADGLVFVSKPTDASSKSELDYIWDFYNCDGSSAEMCGNASRAMHLFVSKYLNYKKKVLHFGTLSGSIASEFMTAEQNNLVKVEMPKWKVLKEQFNFLINFEELEVIFLNTGVPHIVIEVNKLNNKDFLYVLAKEFRYFDLAGPKGTNITFYRKREKNKIDAVTFERGVEDFTKSCGTGAVAAAIAFSMKNSGLSTKLKDVPDTLQQQQQLFKQNTTETVDLSVPGGELKVIINFDLQSAYLIGEAQVNFELKFN